MNIYDLPIEPNETVRDKTKAFIHKNKIVCHPDLMSKVIEGMKIMRASAEGFDKDMVSVTLPKGVEEKIKNRSRA